MGNFIEENKTWSIFASFLVDITLTDGMLRNFFPCPHHPLFYLFTKPRTYTTW